MANLLGYVQRIVVTSFLADRRKTDRWHTLARAPLMNPDGRLPRRGTGGRVARVTRIGASG
jgi:hypothetical protein